MTTVWDGGGRDGRERERERERLTTFAGEPAPDDAAERHRVRVSCQIAGPAQEFCKRDRAGPDDVADVVAGRGVRREG